MKGVLIDAGPLVGLLHEDDQHHDPCVRSLADLRDPLWTVWPAVTEAACLLSEVSPRSPDRLMELLESGTVGLLPLSSEDLPRIRALMLKYRDLPMDLADAALVCAAEREGITTVFTTDQRHFRIYRPSHARSFAIIP